MLRATAREAAGYEDKHDPARARELAGTPTTGAGQPQSLPSHTNPIGRLLTCQRDLGLAASSPGGTRSR